uniref:Uncharacterized protein n=1 Tax=Acrobeloides nanus TaxID=290746 RepID=A0A914D608_9BILA
MYSACTLFLANLMFFAVFIVRDNLHLPDPNLKYVYGIMLDLTSDIYYMYNAYSIMLTSKEIRLTVKKILFVGASSAVHVHPKVNLSPNNNVVVRY